MSSNEASSRSVPMGALNHIAAVTRKRLFPLMVLSGTMLMFGDVDQLATNGSPMSEAQAIIGRPLTPLSVAGVARRTTRRAIRRQYYCHGIMYYHPCL